MTKPTNNSKPTRREESKLNGSSEKHASPPTLTFAGVVLFQEGEDPKSISDEELDRRFAAAKAAASKKLHEEGYLPLRTSKG